MGVTVLGIGRFCVNVGCMCYMFGDWEISCLILGMCVTDVGIVRYCV